MKTEDLLILAAAGAAAYVMVKAAKPGAATVTPGSSQGAGYLSPYVRATESDPLPFASGGIFDFQLYDYGGGYAGATSSGNDLTLGALW